MIKILINKLCEVKKSNISGLGVFINKDIFINKNIGLGFKKINNTRIPDKDYIRTQLGKYINHSNNPNCMLKKINNKYFIFTIKNIFKNEEITLNYNEFDWEGNIDF